MIAAVVLGVAARAQAQCCPSGELPSSGTTSYSGIAFEVESNGGTDAIFGYNPGAGDGIRGESSTGNGVWGYTNTNSGSVGAVFGDNVGQGYGVEGRSSGTGSAVFGNNTSSTGYAGNFAGNVLVQQCLTVWGWGNVGNGCSSDERLKKDVQTISGSLDRLSRLRPVTYRWKDPAEHAGDSSMQYGFIAQEVEPVIPEWVGTNDRGFKTVSQKGLDVMLVRSVQELKSENDELRDRVRSLESGRRPMLSGLGEGGIGLGILGLAAAMVMTRNRRERRA